MGNRATIKDVAREAQVSAATISYVLNGKENISTETTKKVRAAIKKLDYVPNLSARGLVRNDSKLIGVVIPQTEPGSEVLFNNSFYSEVVGSIEYHARQSGYHLLISATDADESYFNLAKKRNLDGIIVIGAYPDDFYSEVKRTQAPIVLIDSYFEDHYFHSIKINDRYGGYIATKHLLEKGHRKIAIFTGILNEGGVMKNRYYGYLDALKEYGLPADERYVFEGKVDFDAGLRLANQFMAGRCDATAVFCTADIMAIGAVKSFHDGGKSVPDDISILGFDDLVISQYITPGLTTVHQDIHLKGERAVELLMNSIAEKTAGKQEVILPIYLVERGSVKQI